MREPRQKFWSGALSSTFCGVLQFFRFMKKINDFTKFEMLVYLKKRAFTFPKQINFTCKICFQMIKKWVLNYIVLLLSSFWKGSFNISAQNWVWTKSPAPMPTRLGVRWRFAQNAVFGSKRRWSCPFSAFNISPDFYYVSQINQISGNIRSAPQMKFFHRQNEKNCSQNRFHIKNNSWVENSVKFLNDSY